MSTDNNNKIAPFQPMDVTASIPEAPTLSLTNTEYSANSMLELFTEVRQFVKKILVPGVDFAAFVGDKPSLLQPGAQKFVRFFGYDAIPSQIKVIENWDTPISLEQFPLFQYHYAYLLYHGDTLVAQAEGSCNSYEQRFRWRWVKESELPIQFANKVELLEHRENTVGEFKFAIDKRETGGKWGKPEKYWDKFEAAIEDGTAEQYMKKASKGKEYPAYRITMSEFRVPNTNIYDQVNTVLKIAMKRALVAATLLGCMASEFFTQDVDEWGDREWVTRDIRNVIPSHISLRQQLISYGISLGLDNQGYDIRDALAKEDISFSLDKWDDIVDAIDNYARTPRYDEDVTIDGDIKDISTDQNESANTEDNIEE